MTHSPGPDWTCTCGYDYFGGSAAYSWQLYEAHVQEPTVCIAHGRFIPCRKSGEHRYTSNPFWVKSVEDYQNSPIEDLTWEPAWEGSDRGEE